MASLPTNFLQHVAEYASVGVSYLDNLNCFVPTLNTTLKDFQNRTAQLGTTVNIELPYRYRSANGLVVTFQSSQQRLHPLTVMQAKNVSYAFTEQDFIYNAKEYMKSFGKGAIEEMSADIEATIALNATSHVPVMTLDSNGQSVPTGALKTADGPFRFYGDGISPINSFGQLALMESFYREYGAAQGMANVFLPNMMISNIIDTGANQFTPARNDKLTMSWDLGTYKGGNCKYYRSNLLPKHTAGTLGNDQTTLTLVSVSADGTTLVFSGAGTDSNAVKSGDLGQFLPSAGINFVTFIGHRPSECPVQFRVLADAPSSAGNVTVTVTPALISDSSSPNQNLTKPLVAGMTAKLLPDHKAGLLVGGDAFYLAMPAMGRKSPYDSATVKSDKTGVSIRNYYGSTFGGNNDGYVNDCIFDTALLQDYCMRVIQPA